MDNRQSKKAIFAARPAVFWLMVAVSVSLFLWLWLGSSTPDMCFDSEQAYDWSDGFTQVTPEGAHAVTLPAAQPDQTAVYRKTLRQNGYSGNSILFRTHCQDVEVLLDGEKLYAYTARQNTAFPVGPSSAWQLIRLPQNFEGRELEIRLTNQAAESPGLQKVWLGTKNALVYQVLRWALPSVLLCLPALLLGTALSLGSFFFKEKLSARRIRDVGLFALTCGIWVLLESRSSQLFMHSTSIARYLSFTMFALIPLMLFKMLLGYRCFEKSRFMGVLYWCAAADFLLVQTLQVSGAADYTQTLFGSHLLLIVGAVNIFIQYIKKGNRHRYPEARPVFSACIAFAAFGVLDLIRFYFLSSFGDDVFFSRIGLLVFIVVLGWHTVGQAAREERWRREHAVLKKLAFQDMLTGIPNRTAFEEKMDTYKTEPQLCPMLLMADLNLLKEVNDREGHSAGDRLLEAVAEHLRESFGREAEVFRIGGDEFCVLSDILGDAAFDERLAVFYERMQEEGRGAAQVACGYCRRIQGEDINATFRRADAAMYRKKARMKQAVPHAPSALGEAGRGTPEPDSL